MRKSTVEEIRRRFDGDVERFSNLESGQASTIDSAFVLDILTEAAAAVSPQASTLLDIGCGAGNYTLKMLERIPRLSVTLLDLSRPMLEKATERISEKFDVQVVPVQGDIF